VLPDHDVGARERRLLDGDVDGEARVRVVKRADFHSVEVGHRIEQPAIGAGTVGYG